MSTTRLTSPVEANVAEITGILRVAIEDGRRRVSVRDLIDLLGPHSHLLVILVFCILNMLPGPPGYGGTMAAAIFTFSLAMARDKSVWVPSILAKRRLPTRVVLRMLERLAWLSRHIAKVSKPRMYWLSSPPARRMLAVLMMGLCLPMAVPIPFMSAIPNVGLTLICVSLLNRDGALVLAGIVLASIGVLVDIGIVWAVVSLGLLATGAISG